MDYSAHYVPSLSARLPIELLQQIYQLLSALDFDAARHTCRLWLFASLDRTLLLSQLKSGGWKTGAEQDLSEASDHFGKLCCWTTKAPACKDSPSSGCRNISTEWIWSKRLAAETRLCSDWRGIWPSDSPDDTRSSGRRVALHDIKTPTTQPQPTKTADPSLSPSSLTVSGCSKFVLLAQDRVIFIYSIQNFKSGMKPLTSILCPRRIVNVSMDTSCGWYAVGILLEGRIGMCWEVDIGEPNAPPRNRVHPSMSLSDFRNFDVRATSRPPSLISAQEPLDFDPSSTTRPEVSPQAEAYRRRRRALGSSGDAGNQRGSSFKITDSNFHNGSGEEFNPPISNARFSQFFPQRFSDEPANQISPPQYSSSNLDPITGTPLSVELGARKTYQNLCTVQDPPISVAICPQRQCIAFGCRTGVELHWIDALRGSTLSRYRRPQIYSC
jgi:hypothetical protein